jgi:hypothetical protein
MNAARIEVGQGWRSLHSRRLYHVLGIDGLGVKVEDLQPLFPLSPIFYMMLMPARSERTKLG